jgi:hypothetical protein
MMVGEGSLVHGCLLVLEVQPAMAILSKNSAGK